MDTYSSSINHSLVQKLLTAIILAVAFFISAGMVIYMSLRGKEVKVPELIGKSEGDAEKLLVSEGLRLKVRNRTTHEKIQANLISEQTPNGGVTVKAGQVVSVIVSTGIEAKKEDAKAVAKADAKPTASATAKPKPKSKPNPSPADEKDKGKDVTTTANKNNDASKGKDANKASNKGETVKGKPSPSPSAKASPKPTAKPSPKKPGTN